MKETKINSGGELVLASDIYANTKKRLILDTFKPYQKEAIILILEDIKWIEPLIKSATIDQLQKLYCTNLDDMKKDILVHPLVWSALYYFYSMVGIETSEMRKTINQNKNLKVELKNELWRHVWN